MTNETTQTREERATQYLEDLFAGLQIVPIGKRKTIRTDYGHMVFDYSLLLNKDGTSLVEERNKYYPRGEVLLLGLHKPNRGFTEQWFDIARLTPRYCNVPKASEFLKEEYGKKEKLFLGEACQDMSDVFSLFDIRGFQQSNWITFECEKYTRAGDYRTRYYGGQNLPFSVSPKDYGIELTGHLYDANLDVAKTRELAEKLRVK